MNPKIKKVEQEIDKIKDKISTYQARLRELEKQKTDLENADIVALFRGENLSEGEFAAFVQSLRKKNSPVPTGQPIKEEMEIED